MCEGARVQTCRLMGFVYIHLYHTPPLSSSHTHTHTYTLPFSHPGLLPYKTGEKHLNLSNILFQLSSSCANLKRQNPPLFFPSPHLPPCPLWLLTFSPRSSGCSTPTPSPASRRHQTQPPPCKGLRQQPITLGPLTVPILL